MNTRIRISSPHSTRFRIGVALAIVAVVSGVAVVWTVFNDIESNALQIAAGVTFTVSLISIMVLLLDPDNLVAQQSNSMLELANETLECLRDGLTEKSAQRICELLMPTTPALSVCITDRNQVLGYTGYGSSGSPQGGPIRTAAIREVIADGKARTFYSNDKIGAPLTSARINAAIIEPLYVGRKITGALMFCYRSRRQVNQTQMSIVRGFSRLLSTQISAAALEEQTKLATSMELKMLQAQINPHFLFNTINTIASFIRTDPNQARELLREFAVFYRSTLEDANDLIPLEREIKQVGRYFMFERARFGEDRLSLEIDIDPEVNKMMVPSFMIQPLVENSVQHAMKSEGKLTIIVTGHMTDEDVIIQVIDDGVGMSPDKLRTMMSPESSQGLGIAVRNVHDRMRSYFGPGSRMEVSSELDHGTVVSFTLKKGPMGSLVSTDGAQSLSLGEKDAAEEDDDDADVLLDADTGMLPVVGTAEPMEDDADAFAEADADELTPDDAGASTEAGEL